jgi:micrococcal nuclease
MLARSFKRIFSIVAVAIMLAMPAAPIASTASAAMPYGAEYSARAANSVTITKHPGTVRRGATASVAAKTSARIGCTITVQYKSGPSKAAGIVPKTSDASGNVSWSWKVGTNTTPGSWSVIITCGGATARTIVTVPR